MKVNGLVILIATTVIISMSSLPTANAIGHWLNRIRNRLTSDCSYNDNCDRSEICREGKCISACFKEKCKFNEGCQIIFDHYASCQCLPGFIRDHNRNCIPDLQPICRSNMDCDSSEICFNNECINACYKKSCKLNEACQVINHKSSCVCLPNFLRDPDNNNCVPMRTCSHNSDCNPTEVCNKNKCVSACYEQTCKIANQTCQVTDFHSFSCECSPGYVRSDHNQCSPICSSNDDCNSNEECAIINHIPTCKCLTGYVPYDPNDLFSSYGCLKHCDDNSGCDTFYKCRDNKCVPACEFESCGIHAECVENDHTAICHCPLGFIGDPNDECIKICQNNDDCGITEKCSGGNCTDACAGDPCGKNALCTAFGHAPVCKCKDGYTGNPYTRCVGSCENNDECEDDEQCDLSIKKCFFACNVIKCGYKARCYAQNHHTVCRCFEGHSGNPQYKCIKNCIDDNDCGKFEKCQNKTCMPACQNNRCAPHGTCDPKMHKATCICNPGYVARLDQCIQK